MRPLHGATTSLREVVSGLRDELRVVDLRTWFLAVGCLCLSVVWLYFAGIFAYVGLEQGPSNWMSQFLATQHGLNPQVEGANAVIIATNHSEFEKLLPELPRKALLVDPWNVTGSAQVFAYVDELVPA